MPTLRRDLASNKGVFGAKMPTLRRDLASNKRVFGAKMPTLRRNLALKEGVFGAKMLRLQRLGLKQGCLRSKDAYTTALLGGLQVTLAGQSHELHGLA